MHLVALEKVFETVCLDFNFVTGQNPSNFTKATRLLCFSPKLPVLRTISKSS